MNIRIHSRYLLVLLAAAVLGGCKADPAPSAGFADASMMKNDPNMPFNRFWRKPGLDLNHYDKIYIAEINMTYLMKDTNWQQGERKGKFDEDLRKLADYTRNSIMKAFREDPKHHFAVVDNPEHDPHTLICEVALIEVVPSKVLLNALGYAPFYVGTSLTVVRTLAKDESTVAFEARIRDAATGEVVMSAADREAQQFAFIDVRGLAWYSDAEGIIDEWSKLSVLVMNAKPGEKVEGIPTFRLLPW